MAEKTSFLHSGYIIDGINMNLTPARMLDDCLAEPQGNAPGSIPYEPIVDETVDLAPSTFLFDEKEIGSYLDMTLGLSGGKRTFPVPFAGSYSCGKIAQALIDAIWMHNCRRRSPGLTIRWVQCVRLTRKNPQRICGML